MARFFLSTSKTNATSVSHDEREGSDEHSEQCRGDASRRGGAGVAADEERKLCELGTGARADLVHAELKGGVLRGAVLVHARAGTKGGAARTLVARETVLEGLCREEGG